MTIPFIVPTIRITRTAIEQITDEVMRHPNIETGWGLYGVVMDDLSVIITGVILATSVDIQRSVAFTTVGGEEMGAARKTFQGITDVLPELNPIAVGRSPGRRLRPGP